MCIYIRWISTHSYLSFQNETWISKCINKHEKERKRQKVASLYGSTGREQQTAQLAILVRIQEKMKLVLP